MANPGAGNSPIVKLEDLVVGTSYRLLDPRISSRFGDYMGDLSDEYKKMVDYLHARPHTLQVKRRLENGVTNLWFTMLPDESIESILTQNGNYTPATKAFTDVRSDMFPKKKDTEFAQEPLRGGKRKTRKQKRKARKSRRRM